MTKKAFLQCLQGFYFSLLMMTLFYKFILKEAYWVNS